MNTEATDQQIIDSMLACTTVEQWNSEREEVKIIRSNEWIIQNIDAHGLIGKSAIK